jgi:hypothetical protein
MKGGENMITKTIKELQLLETALITALSYDENYEIQFLCKLDGDLITCNTLSFLDNHPCIPALSKSLRSSKRLDVFTLEYLLQAVAPDLSGSSLTAYFADITQNQENLFIDFIDVDFSTIELSNTSLINQLPPVLRNVTFLTPNKFFPYVVVDADTQITLLSITATLRNMNS